MAVTPDKKAPVSFMLFFFASPKKNQKRSPAIPVSRPAGITPRLRDGSLIKLLYYCGLYIGNSILGI